MRARLPKGFLVILGLLLLFFALGRAAFAADVPPLPAYRDARFLGVDTCGSSECHGSAEPWRNATVLMKSRLLKENMGRMRLPITVGQRRVPDSGPATGSVARHFNLSLGSRAG